MIKNDYLIMSLLILINIQLSKEQLFDNQKPSPLCFIAFGGGLQMCPVIEFARIKIPHHIHYLVTRVGLAQGLSIDHFNHSKEAAIKFVLVYFLLPKDLMPILAQRKNFLFLNSLQYILIIVHLH